MSGKRFFIMSVLVILLLTGLGLYFAQTQSRILVTDAEKSDMSWLQEDQLADIGGTWEFFDQMLYEDIQSGKPYPAATTQVPHQWDGKRLYDGRPYGYATYRTKLSGLDPHRTYGIFVQDEAIAYRLLVNDTLILQEGTVARTKEAYVPIWKIQWGTFQADHDGNAVLVMEIANLDYFKGGFWHSPIVGSPEAVNEKVSRKIMAETIVFASTLIMGLFFFALYAKSDKTSPALILGMFSILVSLRTLFTGYRLIYSFIGAIPWELSNRIQYLVGYLLLPVAGYLVAFLSVGLLKRIALYFSHLNLALSVLIPVFTPIVIYNNYIYAFRYFVLVTAILAFLMLAQRIKMRAPSTPPIAVALGMLVLSAVAELFLGGIPYVVAYATVAMIGIFITIEIQNFAAVKHQKEQLETEVHVDQLTGVQNRLALEKLLNGNGLEVRKHHSWHVLFMDVDDFKQINDNLGHSAGDMVLKEVGRVLRQVMRDSDQIYRYGGDEFVIFAEMKEGQSAEELIRRIQTMMRKPVEANGNQIQVNLSIGSVLHDPSIETLKNAILRSDDAMYQVKQNRKGEME